MIRQWLGAYQAVVIRNDDPLGQQRVTLQIPQVLGTAVSQWASPVSAMGATTPTVGSGVTVLFLGGDINHPVYLSAVGSIQLTPTVQSAGYTAAPGDMVLMDVSGATHTVTLPAAPADKTTIGVKLYKQSGTNSVTVTRGGTDTFDDTAVTSRSFFLLNQTAIYQYDAALMTWITLGGFLSLTVLDTRYAKGTTPAASATFQPADPTGTTNATTGVMMGLGVAGSGNACVFTPAGTGKVKVTITGLASNTAAAQVTVGARYGTGTPPANGGAAAGTRFGMGSSDFVLRPAAGGVNAALSACQIITGLAVGTQFWVDLLLISNSISNTVSVSNLCVTFEEEIA